MTSANTVDIRNVEEYWDRRPCNVRHSAQQRGSRAYFDEVEARRFFVEPHIPSFAQFERWIGRNVLEIGCGIGTDAINFARCGANYTGIELSKESLELAKQRFKVYELAGTLLQLNAEDMTRELPLSSFDLVYSFGVIHHTPNQRAVIEQARRVIAPDGELRIMLYAKNSWKSIMIDHGFDQPEAQFGCPLATVYDQAMVEDLFSGLFKISSIEQAHIFPYVIEKYVNYEYEHQPWFKAMPPEMFAALQKRLGWHLLIVGTPI